MDGTLSQATLKKNEEGELQSLNNIQQLQAMEKELYNTLEANVANNVNPNEQGIIIKKINELSQLRINLFKTLSNTYDSVQSSIANSRVNLVDQLTAVGVVENELNNAKKQLNQLETNKHDKMRMVEINTYYGKRYKAHTQVAKKLIFICIPLLILAILKKKDLIPPFIPEMVIYGISALIILAGGYSLIRTMLDINSRDNMDFDEYNWGFDPTSMKPSLYENDTSQTGGAPKDLLGDAQTFAMGLGLGCVGASCCSEGMTYDENIKKCIKNVAKETFVTGQLTQGVFNGSNDVVYIGKRGEPEPYSAGVQFASTY
jgi:hypothetical protein